MSDLLIQGLEISFLGMGLTFASLGILILTMILLERAFRPKQAAAVEPSNAAQTAAEVAAGDQEEEIAAAIGVALAYLRHKQAKGRASLGETLTAGRGGWWAAGQSARASQFNSTSRGNG